MMSLLLITSNATVRKRFGAAERSRTFELAVHTAKYLENGVGSVGEPTLCYLDITECGTELRKVLRTLAKNDRLRVGIIDRDGAIEDVGELFHSGVVDYLGPKPMKSEITTRRLKAALELRPITDDQVKVATRQDVRPQWNVSGRNWNGVTSGKEYTFVLLYVEIDLNDEWKQKSGRAHLGEVMSAFHKHVETITAPLHGRVWMWTETGGVVLFPFDGDSCPQIELCFKTILDRTIISVEHYTYNALITYRMALHVGNTLYQDRGNTGTLISDTVNFTFHLGQKFLDPGNFCITETVAPFLARGLRGCFSPAGEFEQTSIYRMKLPV